MFQKNWRCNIIMKRSVQKWMAVILSCCICLSIWSAAALAAGTGEFDRSATFFQIRGWKKEGKIRMSGPTTKIRFHSTSRRETTALHRIPATVVWGTFSITAINRRSSIKKSKSQFQASMSFRLLRNHCRTRHHPHWRQHRLVFE